MSQRLTITTLGSFGISVGTAPFVPNWPGRSARHLFCTLLSPLDESIPWDRLHRSLSARADAPESREKLQGDVEKINALFQAATGTSPILISTAGVGINHRVVSLDARHFRESALSGLALMAKGEISGMHLAFRQARSWYGGLFLPGYNSRIIRDTRTELVELFGLTLVHREFQRTPEALHQPGNGFQHSPPAIFSGVAP